MAPLEPERSHPALPAAAAHARRSDGDAVAGRHGRGYRGAVRERPGLGHEAPPCRPSSTAAAQFLGVSGDAMAGAGTVPPLPAPHRRPVGREGPLGRARLAPGGGRDPGFPMPQAFVRRWHTEAERPQDLTWG